MSTSLVKIQPAPPLSQSKIKLLACPRSYRAIEVDGLQPPPSGPSDRGTEIHEVNSTYTNYCVDNRVPADWAEFDRIANSVGAEAAAILEGVRDNYKVDYEDVVGTEIWFCLDDNFNPIKVSVDSQDWTRAQKREWSTANGVAFEGTIDVGLLLRATDGLVDDWKSNQRPFDAPDEQSDMYSLAWLLLYPQLQTVKFRFRFVRYRNCERVADYTREDLPRLMAALEHYRAKQLAIHARPEQAEAIPSKQCLYCPLLNNGCPIDPMVNSWAQGGPQDWIQRAVYLDYARTQNNERMKEWVQASGSAIEYRDGTGTLYAFGARPTESLEFPLIPTMQHLIDWKSAAPDDVAWFDQLVVGSTALKSKLKAKKRAVLDQAIRDSARPVTKVKVQLHKPKDDNEKEEWDAE